MNRPGFYFITFNGAAGLGKNPVEVKMYIGNAEVPGAISSVQDLSGQTPSFPLSFSTIVQVKPRKCKNPVQITFRNGENAATYSNVNVVVTKLC